MHAYRTTHRHMRAHTHTHAPARSAGAMTTHGAAASFEPKAGGNGARGGGVQASAIIVPGAMYVSESSSRPWPPTTIMEKADAYYRSRPEIRKKAY